MGEEKTIAASTAMESETPSVPHGEFLGPRNFGKVCKALWPRKTAAHLAAKSNVTERAAKHWIAGTREPSALAVSAVVAEMLN